MSRENRGIFKRPSLGQVKLRAWRLRMGLTSRNAAVLTNLDTQDYSKFENGYRPGLVNAVKIQKVTGVACEEWVTACIAKDLKSGL